MFSSIIFFGLNSAVSQNNFDSLKVKIPKHYFNTLIVIDSYNKPNKKIDSINAISKQLKSYGYRQRNISFQIPIFTKDQKGVYSDTNVIANHHVLLTGTFLSLTPTFNGIAKHQLVKRGIGLRYIYNTGQKGIWFFDVAPFITRDVSFKSKAYARIASTFVYSYNFSYGFSLRGGITKSFLWGNRMYLPFVGIRIGRLDKINVSIQFPRSININLPINNHAIFSIYTKPQGGMYNFSNHDSLYFKKDISTFHFTMNELTTGLRFDLRFKRLNFYTAIGISSKNNVTFYSDKVNARTLGSYRTYFYTKNMPSTLFLNLGFVIKLGKTRSIYNNRNLYDAIDLNNSQGLPNNNAQIPVQSKKTKSNNNLESIQDLIDYTDF